LQLFKVEKNSGTNCDVSDKGLALKKDLKYHGNPPIPDASTFARARTLFGGYFDDFELTNVLNSRKSALAISRKSVILILRKRAF